MATRGTRTASAAATPPDDVFATQLRASGLPGAAALGRAGGKVGLRTVRDLLMWLPRRYDDLRTVYDLGSLRFVEPGTVVSVRARVLAVREGRTARRHLQVVTATLADATGAGEAQWYGRQYVQKRLAPGEEYLFSGKLKKRGIGLLIDNPAFQAPDGDLVHVGRIVPTYALTAGLALKSLRAAIRAALDRYPRYPEYLPGGPAGRRGPGRDRDRDRAGALPGRLPASRRGPAAPRVRRAAGAAGGDGLAAPPARRGGRRQRGAARGPGPGDPRRPRGRPRGPRRGPGVAHARPGRGDGRRAPRPGGPAPHAAAPAGRRRLGEDGRRRLRPGRRGRRRRAGRPARPDRPPRPPARRDGRRPPGAARDPGHPAHGVALGPRRGDGAGRDRGRPRLGGGRDPRPVLRAGPLCPPGARGRGRAAPLRGGAARRAGGQDDGRRGTRPADDGHPDPAHAGAGAVRRPGRVGPAHGARRAACHRHAPAAPGCARPPLGSGARRGGRRASHVRRGSPHRRGRRRRGGRRRCGGREETAWRRCWRHWRWVSSTAT